MSKEIQVKTVDEALSVLRGAGRIYVHCRIDAGIEGDDKRFVPDYYSAGLRVTRPAAVSYLRSAFQDRVNTPSLPARTLRMITRTDAAVERWCKKTRQRVPGKPVKVVWIG